MGLLTNANSGQGLPGVIMDKLVVHSKIVSWLLYFAGVLFIFVMPYADYSHKTYFSENALLPGLVKVDFDMESVAKQFLESLREEAQKTPSSPPFPWIEARLKQMGLEVYRHNFTLHFPLGKREQYTGDNIYAILRAPRASSTEGLVFATPYRPPLSIESPTDVSLALLLTVAKFFRHQKYWAKDIVFLITQHEQLGMQAWLEAYHRTPCGYTSGSQQVLDYGDLEARVGSIQAAINLEISHEKFTHLNVKLEGLNGQLPNLDLFNLVTRLSVKEGLPPMFQGIEDASYPESYYGYMKSLKTFVSMAMKQAAGGVPSGNHGLFHRFGIEAVSIESVHKFTKKTRRREFGLWTAGRIIEGIFRSLNNLLERFHQSFFFYLLASTSKYVSIGMYMPAFGLLAGSMLVSALGLWFKCVSEVNPSRPNQDEISPMTHFPKVNEVMQGWILCHLLGIMMVLLPRTATTLGIKADLPSDDSVALAILAYCLVGLYVMRDQKSFKFGKSWRLVKCVTLLETSALVASLSLCNFSLAYIVTLFLAPVMLIVEPSKTKMAYIFRLLLVILVHPLSLVLGFCTLDTFRSFPEKSILGILPASISAAKQAIMFSISDGYIYGNYVFVVCTVCLLPCWLLLWHIVNAKDHVKQD